MPERVRFFPIQLSRDLWPGKGVQMIRPFDDRDRAALPENYRAYLARIAHSIPVGRIFIDPLRTLAWGTDASFYRLIPKIVVKVRSVSEVVTLLEASHELGIALTFRAAGTSLSGQAISDSVLVVVAGAFRHYRILEGGAKIALEPGIVGARANALLAGYGRKIGPDPASIDAAMIGGIAANNASGMCCGTAQNSYRTVAGMKLVLHDGALLDSADPPSRAAFVASHGELLSALAAIRDEIREDAAMASRLAEKYRIKNTTGYGLNAFIDYVDPVDILIHLMIGSEGTLGFIAEITYETVIEHPHKASALMLFPDIESACRAATILKEGPVSAVELMDRASLRSVEGQAGMPAWLDEVSATATALLVEVRAADPVALGAAAARATEMLAGLATERPVIFTDKYEEYSLLWNIRKGLFPAVGAVRRAGTTVVIEDVVFPISRLAEATVELRGLMGSHGYAEGIIFGHALDGNLHFVFTQDFGDEEEVRRYETFMKAVTEMVVTKYDGSLKGEHGTGRNMAPFVEMEWGERLYSIMKRVKALFDPKGLINPGVLVSDDPRAHISHLKPLPAANDIVDRCIECGFCEPICPSKDITITPRQRIAVTREIARLKRDGAEAGRLARLEKSYVYFGEQTCAVDGLCATSCPVSIDTGRHTKEVRRLANGPLAKAAASALAGHMGGVTAGLRFGLATVGLARNVLGAPLLGAMALGARRLSGQRIPAWNPSMPGRSGKIEKGLRVEDEARKVVYFPSCIVRSMGASLKDEDKRSLHEAMRSLLDKAGWEIILPKRLDSLCCGMPFASKGFPDQAERKRLELEAELIEASDGGRYPILFDTSPCLYTVKANSDRRLRLYEPVEFIHDFLLADLSIAKIDETVTIHVTCSSRKLGLAGKFKAVAEACAERVHVPLGVGCCGVAGDRVFLFPELSASALGELKENMPKDCRAGYSNSRTCEIGLSLAGGIPYQSIVYLVDRSAKGRGPSSR